jgi:hypothetical protein
MIEAKPKLLASAMQLEPLQTPSRAWVGTTLAGIRGYALPDIGVGFGLIRQTLHTGCPHSSELLPC